jgi:hypothetical protein
MKYPEPNMNAEVEAVLDDLASLINSVDRSLDKPHKRRSEDIDSRFGKEQDELMRATRSELVQIRAYLQDDFKRLETSESSRRNSFASRDSNQV